MGKILAFPTMGLSLLTIDKEPEQSAAPQLPAAPTLPEPEAIKAQARQDTLARQRSRTPTKLTSGAGLLEEPDTAKKSLFGS